MAGLAFILPTFLLLLLVQHSSCYLIRGAPPPTQCRGRLLLYSSSSQVMAVNKIEPSVGVRANRAVVEGCGCYRIFKRRNFKGRSSMVEVGRINQSSPARIKSVLRVPCFSIWYLTRIEKWIKRKSVLLMIALWKYIKDIRILSYYDTFTFIHYWLS